MRTLLLLLIATILWFQMRPLERHIEPSDEEMRKEIIEYREGVTKDLWGKDGTHTHITAEKSTLHIQDEGKFQLIEEMHNINAAFPNRHFTAENGTYNHRERSFHLDGDIHGDILEMSFDEFIKGSQ